MRAPDFWYQAKPAWQARLLAPAAVLVAAGGAARLALGRAQRASIPVVCVGNLVAGGAGKTPVALSLATLAAEAGARPHLLAHGYHARLAGPLRVDVSRHSAADVGDEALLLARIAPTWIARNRWAGAMAAAEAGAGLLIMDDGLQDPSVSKDLSLIVVDGEMGFGNGKVIPAGPLREPAARGLARAHAVVVVGDDTAGTVAMLGGQHLLLRAKLEATPSAEAVAGKRVLAFAGIGRPAKFFRTLKALGCDVAVTVAFADHHAYTANEIMELCERAAATDATPVTTEKDHVRLPQQARAMVTPVPVVLAWEDEAAVLELLQPLMSAGPHTSTGSV